MPNVRIYTTSTCGYCSAAKRFLNQKGIAFEEIDVSARDDLRLWLVETTGQRTVPQIFVGERAIGGYTDMTALDRAGQLMTLVAG